MQDHALQTIEPKRSEIVNIEDSAMSLEGLTRQVALIQRVMDKVMKKDEHYGVIPGTNKPSLLKPGAEKLCLTFRLGPQYEIIREVREKEFIAYTVKCDLCHIPTAQHNASGIGSCNSRETKYRYRSENTGRPVPKEYWNDRDSAKLGGPQYRARKKDKQWFIFEQIENDNPWDLDNTLIKMACKRALVAATLNATAASDIFTQDVEDMSPDIINGEKKKPKFKKPEIQKQENGNGETKTATGPTYRKLYGKLKDKGFDQDDCELFKDFMKDKFKTDKLTEKNIELTLQPEVFEKACEQFLDWGKGQNPQMPEEPPPFEPDE